MTGGKMPMVNLPDFTLDRQRMRAQFQSAGRKWFRR
jgi:hypothetical protein